MLDDARTLATVDADVVGRYLRRECAVFRKTREIWGGYSNMAAGFPLRINAARIRTSEALYQACRFPHRPEVQRAILSQHSPMAAKMKGKPHRRDSRPDFDATRIPIMWWCLRVKLACNMATFPRLLLASGDMPIVEDSHRDAFWGAKAEKGSDGYLVGHNVLGRLLVLLRDCLRERGANELRHVDPPRIPGFLLENEAIRPVDVSRRQAPACGRPAEGRYRD